MDYAPGVKKKGNEIILLTVVVQVPAAELVVAVGSLKFFPNVVPWSTGTPMDEERM